MHPCFSFLLFCHECICEGSRRYTVYTEKLFRNMVAMFFADIILWRKGGPFRWKKGNLPLLLLRSAIGFLGILGNFYAVESGGSGCVQYIGIRNHYFYGCLCVFLKQSVKNELERFSNHFLVWNIHHKIEKIA